MATDTQLTYSKIAAAYDAFLTVSGFKRGVENFLERLELTLPPRPRLLDAGCGTGLISSYLTRRFPQAEILAFDIDPAMLRAMERKLEHRRQNLGRSDVGLAHPNIILAAGDLRNPAELRIFKTRQNITIPKNYFDAIFVSGALEHVPLAEAIPALAGHLKPGGIFLNLGVRRNPAGAVLGMVYRFRPYRIAEMRRAFEAAGLAEIRTLRLAVEDFPANLSRIAIIAKKLEIRK